MLDEAAELVFELGVDRLIERTDDRSRIQQACLFLGVVAALIAIALAAVSGLLYGAAAGVVALALLRYGA
ncbi:hypothetical protein C488_09916 [Natrinema pellirubrum DSM 15624]|uniref:Uncharacterized protein n=1 Tax=Natrinema pellirubrum (strain DSM 15624 / CIP 106293 / JCM 10476 / NCIMB 786 / 157) TaxID=797303 RepID=L0JRF0_NATP1|nr:hypothetical protein [Natrinema pellirubrum]AGB32956.1 hypothetical protein Natpe_3165 [Natrinema pellirubrum DSM 15624]ELY75061.1 hypothetical protein C488_09916 [Natrinema pellirubrum DSM 15624]